MSSQATLREHGLFDRYSQNLPTELREEILHIAAPAWLPIGVGMVHYKACDDLGLSDDDVVAMAERVGRHRDGTFLGVALNLARGVGVTPLTLVEQLPRIWARAFMGGTAGSAQLGPKEFRLEVAGWPCLRLPYCRHALRGLCLGAAKLVAREAYARALPATSHEGLALQISWV
jgi:hypothetical protein